MAVSSKRILLTTSAPPTQTPFSTSEKRPPVGIGFLIAVLRNAGHTVLFRDNYLANYDLPDAQFLQNNKIDYYGIYINTICFRHALKVIYHLEYLRRSKQWNGKIIVGGPHTTVAVETIPNFVDFVVQGEGEEAIVDIVEERVTDRLVKYPRIHDLDTLPMPAWDVFASMPYNWDCTFFSGTPVFTMNTSRGCPFRCTFCSVHSIWGKEYTMFSAERIVADIEFLIATYGAQGIYFREDNFTLNKKRLNHFCNLMIEKGIKIPWVCETRVNTLTRELVELMAESGARGFYFRVESGSPRMLEFMKKDITVDQIKQAFSWCHEFNIRSAASIVVGLPTETPEDIEQTQKLILEIKPTVIWYNIFVGIPTSKLYYYTIDNKLHEFIDDRGLVYLKGHDIKAKHFYGSRWDAGVPVKINAQGSIINPEISVVLSVYNGEMYIENAIRSVLSQTFPNFELIIINDASTDSSADIIRNFDDPRIRIVENESNIGLTASLIKGIRIAKGHYIARMDADDISLPHRFETQFSFLESHPDYALIGSSFYLINDNGETLGLVQVLTENTLIQEKLTEKNWFCHGSTLIRKSAYEVVGGYNCEYKYAQDYDLWLRISEQFKVYNTDEPLYSWRDSAGCISRKKAEEQQFYSNKAKTEASLRRINNCLIKNDKPLVSIIVPTFNRPHLVGNAIQSILNQTYPNVEIVVVNDCGSPVEDIIFNFNTNNSIAYTRLAKNAGLAAARNTGIRMAKGEFIGYLDDDDLFYPDHVETLVSFLQANKAQVAYTDAYMACQSISNGIWETKERKLIYSSDFNNDIILIRNLFPVLCIIHEKQCIDTVGGFDESLKTHEDWDLWIRMSRQYRMHHIKKITAEYVMRKDLPLQMTTNPSSNFYETRKIIYHKYRKFANGRADVIRSQEKLLNNDLVIPQEQKLIKLKRFISDVCLLIEKGDIAGGLALFDQKRKMFPDTIHELSQIDLLMAKLRNKPAAV